MAFIRLAFLKREHEKVCRTLLGDEFDDKLFQEIQKYMDEKIGSSHRLKHGHNREAEIYIRNIFGEIGVKMFRIHLIVDRIQDNLPEIAKEIYNKISNTNIEKYYYSKEESPYCQVSVNLGGADPQAKIMAVSRACPHCGKYIWCAPSPIWEKFQI